jgi:hypothetical protein
MRYWSIALLLCVSPSLAFTDVPLTPRTLDPQAAATLALAIERSALVRSLVAEIESSNVVVHIQFSWEVRAGIGGTTRFVASRGGYRYVRIVLSNRLKGSDRVAILGHELAHAAEIARSDVTDRDGLRRLMKATGYQVAELFFETPSAQQAERTIRKELGLETQPVIELHHHHLRAAGAKSTAEVAKR